MEAVNGLCSSCNRQGYMRMIIMLEGMRLMHWLGTIFSGVQERILGMSLDKSKALHLVSDCAWELIFQALYPE